MPKEKVNISEFRIEDLPASCTMVFIAPPGYGKTTMIETIMYHSRSKYPVGRAWIGTDKSYVRFCKILGHLFVSNYYDDEEHSDSIKRQRTCILENGDYRGNNCVTVIDDLSSDPKIFKNKQFRATFKLGSQHYAQRFMLGMQYAIDMPPDVRLSISYVFIGRINEIPEREKVYHNFCGIMPREAFEVALDQICQDHTFLVICRRSQSNDWRKNVFFLRTEELPDNWRFGCKEFIEWNDTRYNIQYKERMDV